jgi:DNA ligase 1
MTLLADLVSTSRAVAATSSRSAKIAALAELLRRLEPDEVPIAVGFLAGVPRQGRVGVGYATVYRLECAPAAEPTLTIAELDGAIDAVREATGSGSAGRRRRILGELLERATEHEADFVQRLFTGELRQGALAGVMADAVARAAGIPGEVARRALMLSGDLTRTAEIALSEGEEGLRRVGFELFRPVLPMLASTAASAADAVAAFERASVEWKLDGIRIQVHRRGEEVRIYTRNLNEITHALPGIAEAVRRLPLTQAVFDGEALWMGDEGPAAFQDTVSRIDGEAPPDGIVTFLFDVLHLDGEDLLDAPLEERAARLETVARQLRIPAVLTSDPEDGERMLAQALEAGHEGVVVKDAASPYGAGRRGKAWRKVKPVRTYDLAVLGAEWGHGAQARPSLQPPPRRPRPEDGRVRHGREDLQGDDRRAARMADGGAAGARDGARGDRGLRAPRARGRDRPRRRPGLDAVPGRGRAPLRPREALPARQDGRGGGHDRRPPRAAAGETEGGAMSRLIVSTAVTVDGVMSVEDWYVPGGEANEAGLRQFEEAAGMVLGRKNFDGLAGYWSAETGEWADRLNPMPKFVASRTLAAPLTWNATLIEGDLADGVARLKDELEGDLISVGCGELARNLLAAGLVDELRFWVHPAVWGRGERPFREEERFRLRLLATEAFDSGVVLLRYEPTPTSA